MSVLISLIIGAVFVWLLKAGALPVVPSGTALGAVPLWVPVAYAFVWLVVLFLRGVRWYWLLRPVTDVSVRQVLYASFVGYAALVILPLRMGEFMRPAMISRHSNTRFFTATSSSGAERVLDGLILCVFMFTALQLAPRVEPLPDTIGQLPVPANLVPRAAYLALAGFSAALIAMAVFYWWRSFAVRVIQLVFGRIAPRLASWLTVRFEQLTDGLSFLKTWSATGPFVSISLVYWLLNAAGLWLVLRGCGLAGIGFWEAAVVMGVLGLGLLTPNAPGYFGAFQLSVYAGLALFLPPGEILGRGVVAVFYIYVLQIGVILLSSGAAALLGPGPRK